MHSINFPGGVAGSRPALQPTWWQPSLQPAALSRPPCSRRRRDAPSQQPASRPLNSLQSASWCPSSFLLIDEIKRGSTGQCTVLPRRTRREPSASAIVRPPSSTIRDDQQRSIINEKDRITYACIVRSRK